MRARRAIWGRRRRGPHCSATVTRERGTAAVGLDFQPYAYEPEAERRADDPNVTFQLFNLLELRHVLAVSAWVARMPGPRAVGCVHVVDGLGH